MNRIYWIEEGRLAGRCGPRVAPLDMTGLERAGFRTVLSLDANEYQFLRGSATGMELKLIHLTNSIPPKPIEKEIFARRLPESVAFVVEKVAAENGAVLVHCHAGNDRTGGVLAGYLSKTRGILPRAALEQVRVANPEAVSAEGYEAMILSILERE